MAVNGRAERIAQMVDESRYLTIASLSEEFDVSPSTIRRDLKLLEDNGMIKMLYGGVVMRKSPLKPYAQRETANPDEKRAIAVEASRLVRNGHVVIIDAGSTASQVAIALSERKDLFEATIITPAINVARIFLQKPGFKVLLTGGELTAESEGMVGRIAESFFATVHAHFVFLSCVGLVPEHGAMYVDHDRAALRKAMVNVANEVIMVADHTKFGKIAAASGFYTKEIDTLITDEVTSDDVLEEIRRAGVKVKKVGIC